MSPVPTRRIHILRDSVARKIAAGEVIDRPHSVLRELLDNSLDAGCSRIEVHLESGGLKSLQVIDDGGGMSVEDLEICCLPHSTSKIENEEDLQRLSSLGFRGEALASIAVCSRLTITSAQDDSGLAFRLSSEEGKAQKIAKTSGVKGTRVLVEDLFYNLPARKRFLKSTATEGTLCRRVLEEKSLAFPEVAFVLWMDNQIRVQLPRQELPDRLAKVSGPPWDEVEPLSCRVEGEGFFAEVFILPPTQNRGDRKGIRIYANRRPLQEYALVQAVNYAFEGYLPGGVYPHAAVFLQVDPALVDFNIHPAKREARFRTLPSIHHGLVEGIRDLLGFEKLRSPFFETPQRDFGETFGLEPEETPQPSLRGRGQFPSVSEWDPQDKASFWNGYQELRETPGTNTGNAQKDGFRYLGQVLGVFLVAEIGDDLYLIDQHAAHERLLYDRFRAQKGAHQDLLIPLPFELEEEASTIFEEKLQDYSRLGVGVKKIGSTSYELESLPQAVASMEKQVVSFIRDTKKPPQDLEKDLYARLSCRAAVMDGDPVDPVSAREIIRETLKLDNARCPHGRPIWTVLSRQELFQKVGRLTGKLSS